MPFIGHRANCRRHALGPAEPNLVLRDPAAGHREDARQRNLLARRNRLIVSRHHRRWCRPRRLKAENIQELFVHGCEVLDRVVAVKFIERIVGALHATIEKVARIRCLSKICQLGVASIDRKVCGRRSI